MPERKKTSSRASTPRGRARGGSSRSAGGRPVSRRRAPQAKPVEEQDDRELALEPSEQSGSGPVVLGSSEASEATGTTVPDAGAPVAPSGPGETGTAPAGSDWSTSAKPDRFPEDIPIALFSAALLVLPFLPWYRIKSYAGGKYLTASGWSTGTWGPMIAILGGVSLVLALLRIAGVRVTLPVSDAHIHEGVGWLSIVGAVIKFRAVPKAAQQGLSMQATWVIWIVIGAAFVLAFLAGRMSGSSPFVVLPGWFKGAAGAIGAVLLIVAIAGSVVFGLSNNVDLVKLVTGRSTQTQPFARPQIIKGKFPSCAKGFPVPPDAKPQTAVEQTPTQPCVFTYNTSQKVDALGRYYQIKLKEGGYTFQQTTPPQQVSAIQFLINAPTCGSMAISRPTGAKDTSVIVAIGSQCPSPRPTQKNSTPSSSPSR